MATENCCLDLRQVLSPRLFRALADPTRVAILAWLARWPEPQAVGDVAACCPVDLSVVSRHLATLRDAGVVESKREGRQVYYRARCEVLASTLRTIADALEACCPPPEDRERAADEGRDEP